MESSSTLLPLEITKLFSARPNILTSSLEEQIIPCIQELSLFLGIDENFLKAIRRRYGVIESDVVHILQPNIDKLISHGFPQSVVLKLFLIKPASLHICGNWFSEIVNEVMKLGFDPNSLSFVQAIMSMALNTKPLSEQKVKAFRSFGLSDDKICSAFKRQSLRMGLSEKKIKKMMGFFVNKLKMKPSRISKSPILLLLGLEKRIILRCSVLQLLMLEGLIKEDTSIVYIVKMAEKNFMK